MKRRLSREYALKALVMVELGGNKPEGAFFYLLNDTNLTEKENSFFYDLMMGCLKKKSELDNIIVKHLINWEFDRLSTIIRNILRLGVFELLYFKEVPFTVTINEYVELTKIYQDEESAGFVNGILDNIRKETEIV